MANKWYTASELQELKKRRDILELEFRQGRKKDRFICPVCGRDSKVKIWDNVGGFVRWQCVACKEGGTIVDAMMINRGISASDAMQELCDEQIWPQLSLEAQKRRAARGAGKQPTAARWRRGARGVDASTVKSIEGGAGRFDGVQEHRSGCDRGGAPLSSGAASYQHRSVHSIEAAHSGALEGRGAGRDAQSIIAARRRKYCNESAARLWTDDGRRALEYLHGRGFNDETLKRFNIGYDDRCSVDGLLPYGRAGIVIPYNRQGSYFAARFINPMITTKDGKTKETKVMNCKVQEGVQAPVFNAAVLRKDDYDAIIICEGWADAISLTQVAGKVQDKVGVVATGGAGVHGALISELKKHPTAARLIIAFDADAAGREGARELEAKLDAIGQRCEIIDGDIWGMIGGEACKDANDVLQKRGDGRLFLCLLEMLYQTTFQAGKYKIELSEIEAARPHSSIDRDAKQPTAARPHKRRSSPQRRGARGAMLRRSTASKGMRGRRSPAGRVDASTVKSIEGDAIGALQRDATHSGALEAGGAMLRRSTASKGMRCSPQNRSEAAS